MDSGAIGDVVGCLQQTEQGVEEEALAAHCDAPLLITASSSDAVEAAARRVHGASSRAAMPFLLTSGRFFPVQPVMLRAFCSELIHATYGGSLLLNEIEDTPEVVQDRLMDLLGELQGTAAGSAAVRVIAGTTASLYDRVAGGAFSDRLYYRINIIHLVVKNGAP